MPTPTENQLPRKRAMTPFQLTKPIGSFYEHQQWFLQLFDKLNERSIPYVPIDARSHSYNPRTSEDRYSLFFNRMSALAYLRGHCCRLDLRTSNPNGRIIINANCDIRQRRRRRIFWRGAGAVGPRHQVRRSRRKLARSAFDWPSRRQY